MIIRKLPLGGESVIVDCFPIPFFPTFSSSLAPIHPRGEEASFLPGYSRTHIQYSLPSFTNKMRAVAVLGVAFLFTRLRGRGMRQWFGLGV